MVSKLLVKEAFILVLLICSAVGHSDHEHDQDCDHEHHDEDHDCDHDCDHNPDYDHDHDKDCDHDHHDEDHDCDHNCDHHPYHAPHHDHHHGHDHDHDHDHSHQHSAQSLQKQIRRLFIQYDANKDKILTIDQITNGISAQLSDSPQLRANIRETIAKSVQKHDKDGNGLNEDQFIAMASSQYKDGREQEL